MPRKRKDPGRDWTGALRICANNATYSPPGLTTASFGSVRWRWGLPYGLWIVGRERLVLFNRRYIPLWQRFRDGSCEPADPAERVPFDPGQQYWFYNDDNPMPCACLEGLEVLFVSGGALAFVTVPRWTHERGALVRLTYAREAIERRAGVA